MGPAFPLNCQGVVVCLETYNLKVSAMIGENFELEKALITKTKL